MSRGFSLVELSIVLVILGLLTGGILAGQSLIRASELRAVTTEWNRYVTAIHGFRDKYFALPGDMTNATSFWGAAHATPATCLTTVGTGTQTCNGDGDGEIDAASAASRYGERFTSWQHLANAGLIEGSYTGIAGSGHNAHATNTNSPVSKLSAGLWFLAYDITSSAALYPVALPRNNFRLGVAVANSWPYTGIMKPEEMWNIDTKVDDGRPATGTVTSLMSSYRGNCASSDLVDATYVLTHTGNTCIILASLML